MKKILFLLAIFVFSTKAYSQDFDFLKNGDEKSNLILKKHIENSINYPQISVSSYFYDIDCDGEQEIVGIIKNSEFYSLKGYKLIALKKFNNTWQLLPSNIYFDNSKIISINDKKISYYMSVFYDNKKHSGKIKNNKLISKKHFGDIFSDKKIKNIEEITQCHHTELNHECLFSDFKPEKQKTFNISYPNMSDKPKPYLDIK